MKQLKEILSEKWYEVLKDEIIKQKDWEIYLGEDREETFPDREHTFRAINNVDISKVKIVIFGQDPYPRKESATGYAFWDGAVTNWKQPLSPSLRNIFKSVLISKKLAVPTDSVAKLREIVAKNNLPEPGEFFQKSIDNGVLWLNTSLTFTSKDTKELKRHLKFWNPIIKKIISAILSESEKIVFVFWGSKAKELQKIINKIDTKCSYEYVENNHPMMDTFHIKNTFDDIYNAQIKLGQTPVEWL